ncbi:hypothetical protein [Alteromonas sp. H39]|uniref:hypothetical protein n=1 Tax=Alteromonas sp. H39 TaxID=3389876 RepID=UPI0039DF5DAD
MSLLTDYQRAALEVIGIPVWVSQSEVQSESRSEPGAEVAPSQKNTPSPQDRAAKLAALRAQVSSDKTEAADVPALPEKPEAPQTRPVTAQELQASGRLLSDIQLAATLFSEQTLAFEVGEALAVEPGRITLPCVPAELSVKDKRALWKALSQA